MKDYYKAITDIAGATSVIVPVGDPWKEAAGALSCTTYGDGISAVFTYKAVARTSWTQPTAYPRYRRVPTLFPSTAEFATAPDATYWSRGDGAADSAFSVWGWYAFPAGSGGAIIGKFKRNAVVAREWELNFSGADKLRLSLFDESGDFNTVRLQNTAIPNPTNVMFYAATYDGTGGATAANGIVLYQQGTLVASTATNDALYVAMENLTGLPAVFNDESGSGASGGCTFLGGPCGPGYCQVALTAVQIADIYHLGLEAQKARGLVTRLRKGVV